VRAPGPLLGLAAVVAAAVLAAAPSATRADAPAPFEVFLHTGVPLGDVVWTGQMFLYATETTGKFYASDALGGNFRLFASVPSEVEEMRCRLSPGRHGFARGAVYCHSPGNLIYRLDPNGDATVVARLPEAGPSDGSMTFDTRGAFGYALLAATGGSSDTPGGGNVYAVRADGAVRLVGRYPGPGGADNVAIAPRRFGGLGGWLLLTIDQPSKEGRVLAVSPRGRVTVVARGLGDGLNPIAVVAGLRAGAASPRPGFYVVDTNTTNVYFAPAASFRGFVGGVIVGTELHARFWVVRARGKGFQAVPLETGLDPGFKFNFEGATWVGR
jgi:hypothetical protein